MLTAIVLYTITILWVIIPSFKAIMVGGNPIIVFTITSIQGILGILSEVLGIWIVASMALSALVHYLAIRKKLMLPTLTL